MAGSCADGDNHCNAMENEEAKHYRSVLLSFQEYINVMSRETFDRRKRLLKLPPEQIARIPKDCTLLHDFPRIASAVGANQRFLYAVMQETYSGGPQDFPIPPLNAKAPPKSAAMHLSKLKSTLHQCVRDWSAEGAAEREACYAPILEELSLRLPAAAGGASRVLVPGAGLGRLLLEIASRGYSCEGNEFSYQMLFTSHFILNCIGTSNSIEIYPWIHQLSNTFSYNDHCLPVKIPDVVASSMVDPTRVDFSMVAGEFLEVYKRQAAEWNAIVTCFFLDTAPNVIEYIETIDRLLKPGGIWINFGPLQYHWSSNNAGDTDERYQSSIELTHEDIKHVIKSFGLEILRDETRECTYTNNAKSMNQTKYLCTFFTVQKPMMVST